MKRLCQWMFFVFFVLRLNSGIAQNDEFDVFHDGGNMKVILTESMKPQAELDRFGKRLCESNQFCVLWFYSHREDAEKGRLAILSGDLFSATPGMYAIFSKNNTTNNIICYEPDGGC